MGSDFPREDAFDEDYLYFYEELLTPERTASEVELVWKLLELEPGLELLDLACGHGRIANPLAERGVRVTGLDATPLFLELARQDAAARGGVSRYAGLRRGRRTADAGASPDGRRRPEVRVTLSARSGHPRVRISSIRSLWGGGRPYRS